MRSVIGWDVGGANCKATRLVLDGERVVERRSADRPLAIWRALDQLPAVVAEMAAALGPADCHALTMTAELADCFPTRREGVLATVAAMTAALPGAPLRIWTIHQRFVTPAELRADPLAAAAANWVATAARLSRLVPTTVLIDCGSTTADLIPIRNGAVAAAAWDDPGRLASGELVYTGVLRTPVCAVAAAVPVNGRAVRLAAEWFAIMADVHLLLGHIGPADYRCETPDGRGVSAAEVAARLARCVGADTESLSPAAIHLLARALHEAQVQQLTTAALQVLSRLAVAAADRVAERTAVAAGNGAQGQAAAAAPLGAGATIPVTGAGLGRFLARAVAERLGLPYQDLDRLTGCGGQTAPAEAVAWLLGQEVVM